MMTTLSTGRYILGYEACSVLCRQNNEQTIKKITSQQGHICLLRFLLLIQLSELKCILLAVMREEIHFHFIDFYALDNND